jgi:hypothetical protein
VRYERAHPTVALRLTTELKARLKQHLEARGISAATFVKEALGAHPIDTVDLAKVRRQEYETGYREGYEDGYERGGTGLAWPTNLLSRRDRDAEIALVRKQRAAQKAAGRR